MGPRRDPQETDTPRGASPRRDHLVEVATRLFCRDGFHATGIDRVLEEAGVAKMTLYKHFASKDELIGACLEGESARLRGAMDAVLEGARGDAAERALALVDWVAAVATTEGFEGCPFHHARAEFADPAHPAAAVAAGHKRWLRERLRRLLREGGHGEPAAAADRLVVVIEGVLALGPMGVVPRLGAAASGLARAALGLT